MKLTYREKVEIKIALEDRRHAEFCQLSKRSSKSPAELTEVQEKFYGGNIRLGEDPQKDKTVDTMSSMVLCTSMLNKLQDLEDECQKQLGDMNAEISPRN